MAIKKSACGEGVIFLGASGGRDVGRGAACIRVTPSVVIDAGNLMVGLEDEGVGLQKIFLTHAHLDHVVDIPFWLDKYFLRQKAPLQIYGGKETLKTVRESIFSGKLWPPFHLIKLPNSTRTAVEFIEVCEGEVIELEDGITLEPRKSHHGIECFGYIIQKEGRAIYFTSDTFDFPELWETLQRREEIKQLVIDISFPSRFRELAESSYHLTPEIFAEAKRTHLKRKDILTHLFHIKPLWHQEVVSEIETLQILKEKEYILTDGFFLPFDPEKLSVQVKQEPSKEEILRIMFDYVAKISIEKRLDSLLLLMADMAREIVVADRCTLWLLDKGKEILWTKVAHGVETIRIPIGAGIAGLVAKIGETLIINDPYADPRFNQSVDQRTGYKTYAILAMPIYNAEREIIGVYQAINKLDSMRAFHQKDVDYLSLAATYSGSTLESALLQQEIEKTQREIVYTMAEIGESRSKETGYHVKRVAEYSKILALGVGLSEREAELIRIASPMHDIGKVAIPDEILKKPGKLDPREFEIMKTHAEVGYNTLKTSQRAILKAAATIAYEHHEKWNGKGYPQGKRGEDIHIYGRIVALADVFDALGSDRCYKQAWELEKIYDLLREERGEQFDPRLVDAFFENVDAILEIREKYDDLGRIYSKSEKPL